jgi:hypothetical protein
MVTTCPDWYVPLAGLYAGPVTAHVPVWQTESDAQSRPSWAFPEIEHAVAVPAGLQVVA